ncbi:MAG: hypothetical protein JXB39_11055 [Deltaproteobacteria bacterium]|nr:hypothetical protein [Deltaproteobacteria bacterium]
MTGPPPLPDSKSPLSSPLQRLDLRGRIRRLQPSTQVLLTVGVVALLLLDLAVPDVVPFVDEGLLVWLVWMVASTTLESVRERRAPAPAVEPPPALAPTPADAALLEAAEREVEDTTRNG